MPILLHRLDQACGLETIEHCASHPDHKAAKEMGRAAWYDKHMIRIAKVERQYGGAKR